MIQFSDLTEEQINIVWNGVGSKHFIVNPHDLVFSEPSKKHDFLYYKGGTEEDRKRADNIYYLESKEIVDSFLSKVMDPSEVSWRKFHLKIIRYLTTFSQGRYFLWASLTVINNIYCFFLSKLGKYSFEYSEKPRETWEEIEDLVLKTS